MEGGKGGLTLGEGFVREDGFVAEDLWKGALAICSEGFVLDDVASSYRACFWSVVEAESRDERPTYNHDCRDSVENHPEHQLRSG